MSCHACVKGIVIFALAMDFMTCYVATASSAGDLHIKCSFKTPKNVIRLSGMGVTIRVHISVKGSRRFCLVTMCFMQDTGVSVYRMYKVCT